LKLQTALSFAESVVTSISWHSSAEARRRLYLTWEDIEIRWNSEKGTIMLNVSEATGIVEDGHSMNYFKSPSATTRILI
jgi:hypothetical protein